MTDSWSWNDVPWDEEPRPVDWRDFHYGNRRKHGKLSRFVGTSHHGNQEAAALRSDHPALAENRTLFPKSVVEPDVSPRLLVSGFQSAKIGARVTKGAWAGMPIYTLTLEERASCPVECVLLRECFGNAMPFARRHRHGEALERRLDKELRAKAVEHPKGYVVRVHVLGDFYSHAYARMWMRWLSGIPQLHAFGYTAHPRYSPIGLTLTLMNLFLRDRVAFRFSVHPGARARPHEATTIWRQPEAAKVPEGLVCPAQTSGTSCCGTCGLCWSPAMAGTRIVFIGHGMSRQRNKEKSHG